MSKSLLESIYEKLARNLWLNIILQILDRTFQSLIQTISSIMVKMITLRTIITTTIFINIFQLSQMSSNILRILDHTFKSSSSTIIRRNHDHSTRNNPNRQSLQTSSIFLKRHQTFPIKSSDRPLPTAAQPISLPTTVKIHLGATFIGTHSWEIKGSPRLGSKPARVRFESDDNWPGTAATVSLITGSPVSVFAVFRTAYRACVRPFASPPRRGGRKDNAHMPAGKQTRTENITGLSLSLSFLNMWLRSNGRSFATINFVSLIRSSCAAFDRRPHGIMWAMKRHPLAHIDSNYDDGSSNRLKRFLAVPLIRDYLDSRDLSFVCDRLSRRFAYDVSRAMNFRFNFE